MYSSSDSSDANQVVQPQKMARGLKFRIQEVEELCYPCSENKCADQLRGYREPDLRLCFRIWKKPVFSRRGSNYRYLCIQSESDFLGKLFYPSEQIPNQVLVENKEKENYRQLILLEYFFFSKYFLISIYTG